MLSRLWARVLPQFRPAVGYQVMGKTVEWRRRYPAAERKRFYQDVSISQGEGGAFEINLDRRKLKTPQGKLFTVPSEALAIAVATEWDSQRDTLQFFTMHLEGDLLPLPDLAYIRLQNHNITALKVACQTTPSMQTTLCNTALDNPTQRTKEQLIRAALKYLDTDTVCYRVEEPPGLVELQRNEWDPVIKWIENRYNVVIGTSTSILGPNIPKETKQTFEQHLSSYNFWALVGLEYVIHQLKSVVLSLNLIDRNLDVERAVLLSRLEEQYQIEMWGNIEWAHDYELYELRSRTAAGTLFVHLCSESSTVKHKLLQD